MNRSLSFYLLLVGLWLAASTAHAQPQPYRFGLAAEKLDVPAGPWQVTRVLDLRPDRSRLGTVHRGLANQLAAANFTRPLALELQSFIQTKLAGRAGTRPVVLRVFALAISEDMRATSEHAEAEFIADFLEPQPDSTFRVLLTVGETVRRAGVEVTKFHPANIATVLQQGLRQLAALPAPAPGNEVLTQADALAGRGGVTAQRFAIQTGAAPKRGFYRSYQEFLNDAPSEPDFPFAIKHVAHPGKRWAGTDEVVPTYLSTDNSRLNRPVSAAGLWGLSDGTEALIVYRNRFYKLLPAAGGRNYTFMGPPVFDAEVAANMAGAAVVGGLMGAAIAGAANGAATMDPYELHLASGRVVPVQNAGQTDADGFALAPDSARIYVYRRAAPSTQAVSVSAAGRPAFELQARQWTALSWTDPSKDLKLCARAGEAETCEAFVPDFSQPTYLECVLTPDGKPVLRTVPAKEGLFELRRIQRLAKSRK